MSLYLQIERSPTIHGVVFPVKVDNYRDVEHDGLPYWEEPIAFLTWLLEEQGDSELANKLWFGQAPHIDEELPKVLAAQLRKLWDDEIREAARGN